jgi:hypothetical protein
VEHKACIASLRNNGRLNRVLEVAGMACRGSKEKESRCYCEGFGQAL